MPYYRNALNDNYSETLKDLIIGDQLSAQNIIDIHDGIIEIYGGTRGLLNQGTIDHLVYRLDRENNTIKKSALVLEIIITGHPFFDGNKRTAFEVADFILRQNKCHIHVNSEKIKNVLLKIAKYECTAKEIEKWLKRNVS